MEVSMIDVARYITLHNTVRFIAALLLVIVLVGYSAPVSAISSEQRRIFNLQIYFYDHDVIEPGERNTSQAGGAGGELRGACEEEQAWNFFKDMPEDIRLSDVQIAAILGNLEHESGIDPTRIQGRPEGEGSQDPLDAGSLGWGLMQWTPGSRLLDSEDDSGDSIPGLMSQADIETPVYLLESQLRLVWWHLNNTSPTGASNVIEGFRQPSNINDAVVYFERNMEAAGIRAYPQRISHAERFLNNNSTGDWC